MFVCVRGESLRYCDAETLLLHKWFHHLGHSYCNWCLSSNSADASGNVWMNVTKNMVAEKKKLEGKKTNSVMTLRRVSTCQNQTLTRGQRSKQCCSLDFLTMWLCYSTPMKHLEIINWQRFLQMEQWFYARGQRKIRPDDYRLWIWNKNKTKEKHRGFCYFWPVTLD